MEKRKLERLFKQSMAGILAVSLTAGAAACGKEPKGSEQTPTQISSEAEKGEGDGKENQSQEASKQYSITEENENPELVMAVQPESSYWFPEDLLAWNPSEDKDLAYNISSVPLAKRADREILTSVNATQNKDTEVMAISIMNSSTSGNSPHGLNKAGCNTFSYWQYVDKLIYWGGSSGEGLIVAPSPDVVDAGHKNGVPVLGTIFFPQAASGGKLEWLDTFLQKNENGQFPMTDKLIEVAKTYGFDGWFINQETEGNEEQGLKKKHAKLMQEFIAAFKEKAPEIELVYYDSMTVDGTMDWQNALTDKNLAYLKNKDGKAMADSMFLNFWWTEDKLADQELLKTSMEKAEENGIDPYALYAGVDVQSDGYVTPIRWDLFEKSENSTYTSLGLYCPSWTYSSASDMEDFWNKENALWVNNSGDPFSGADTSSNTQWKGISTYVTERTSITALPFTTNFNLGNGYSFFKNGEQISKLDWNNRSLADVLPTYRYHIESEGNNNLKANIDVGSAYYGGNSLKLRGSVEKDTPSTILMYSADLPIPENAAFTTTAMATAQTALEAVVVLDDGSTQTLKGDKTIDGTWQTISFDTAPLAGKSIRSLAYKLTPSETGDYEFNFGNISITDGTEPAKPTVSGVTVDEIGFDEDAMFAGVRLSWQSEGDAAYYEVYRINQDNTRSLLGVSNTTSFYINTLPRTDETNQSRFLVQPVTLLLTEGEAGEVTAEWPDNSLPKADFTSDITLAAPGEKISFESLCSANTTEVAWSFPGADAESDTSQTPSISYAEEGVYDVTLTAKNDSGTAEAEKKGFIVVTNAASKGLSLLSEGAKTEASSYVNDNEAPKFAVDGDITKKWCATGPAPHELTIDLGEVCTVSALDISHAEAGGENADMNTKSYTISVSEDGTAFTEVKSITRNSSGTTHDAFAPVTARYVKLSVVKPTQGSDSAARIYEVQVYGLKK